MSDAYVWKIDSLDVFPFNEGKANVVHKAYWRVIGVNGASAQGWVELKYSQGDAFTAYEKLTEEKVVKWVKEAMSEAEIKAILDSLVTAPAPIDTSLPLPWSNV